MKKVEKYLVASACQMLECFCQRFDAKIGPAILAEFAIAWRECGSFEWTPCEEGFRRILAVSPQEEDGKLARIAIVFGYEGVDEQLTKDLNQAIFVMTRGKWL